MKNNKTSETFEGLAATTFNAYDSKPLTLEDLQRTFDYFDSDEYREWENNRLKMRAVGETIIIEALYQGVITDAEALHLHHSLSINGFLLCSRKMAKKLNKTDLSSHPWISK